MEDREKLDVALTQKRPILSFLNELAPEMTLARRVGRILESFLEDASEP